MIVAEAEICAILGFTDDITDTQRLQVQFSHRQAEAAVKQYLAYDPQQQIHTEYYPRHESNVGEGVWDSNGSVAFLRAPAGIADSLQLAQIPVRRIIELKIDRGANYGQSANAFGASAETWIEGQDFWMEREANNYCRSGILLSDRGWPSEAGSVRVQYAAGYSDKEFRGDAAADESGSGDANSQITTRYVDASMIRGAIIRTAMINFHKVLTHAKRDRIGFVPGVFASESFGDYSYTLSAIGGLSGVTTTMSQSLPPEAQENLESFLHWGLLRL